MLDVWKKIIEPGDIRDRILFTLMMIAIFRIGSFIPCPFISVENLRDAVSDNALMSGVFGVADMFTGQAFSKMTVMSLGIMPYISASIILQLLMVVWPWLEKKVKEGEAGRKFMTRQTRYGTVLLATIQGFGLALFIRQNPDWIMPFMRDQAFLFIMITVLSIVAGTTLLMWIGEKITEFGIGNGISLIIALGIMAAYPSYIRSISTYLRLDALQPIWVLITAGLCIVTTMLIVLIQEGQRKIPIQHAKQAVGGRRMQATQTNYLPLKVNTAGVMPVIFSSAILTLPATVFGWLGAQGGMLGPIGDAFAPHSSYNLYDLFGVEKGSIFLLLKAGNLYTLTFVLLTAFFCFFYTAIVFNPQDVADNLRKMGAFVPGYRPGKQTADYINNVMTRITTVGAIFLCSVAIMPQVMMFSFDLPFELADFAGGTGLIIVVAVVLDTMKQLKARILSKHYEGIKSRRTGTKSNKPWMKGAR